ncbi:unannotated protein [freshwater metagenome]|uniref:Unannotated protein n=1 Tax=freshwater metagenome TaxID=449393 RepID=A0A6J6XEE0_9ZZZZ
MANTFEWKAPCSALDHGPTCPKNQCPADLVLNPLVCPTSFRPAASTSSMPICTRPATPWPPILPVKTSRPSPLLKSASATSVATKPNPKWPASPPVSVSTRSTSSKISRHCLEDNAVAWTLCECSTSSPKRWCSTNQRTTSTRRPSVGCLTNWKSSPAPCSLSVTTCHSWTRPSTECSHCAKVACASTRATTPSFSSKKK